ncbi:MAG TPA: DUF2058 family protein [bacterium]|nr:DUF2058 family protein [bacterium]
MGNLREQLLKAKLIDENQAREARREQRQKRREKGMKALQQEAREKQEAFLREQETVADRNREQAREQRKQDDQRERNLRLVQRIQAGEIREGSRGNTSFYFVARSGIIPCLEISPALAGALRSGSAAIVEKPSPHGEAFSIVNQETAAALVKDAPEIVCFYKHS